MCADRDREVVTRAPAGVEDRGMVENSSPAPARRAGSRAARAAAAGLAAAALLLVAGCGDEVTAGPASSPSVVTPSDAPSPSASPSPAPSPSAPSPSPEPSTEPEPEPSATDGPADETPAPGGGGEVPQEATTEQQESSGTGGALSVVEVRTARHEGFDRVVVELAAGPDAPADAAPGWFSRYTDEAVQETSLEPLDVDGEVYLDLFVRGLGYPFDTGVEELVGSTPGSGTSFVEEVYVGGVFEGQAQVVVGLSEEVPYTVSRLSDPPRVVVDLYG
ncbi:AMIN-like domain-containing (lipo)protein [Pseudokineococcus lusitanus]|nr:hypothetical protein [Pseudokineococcus lusitanus]